MDKKEQEQRRVAQTFARLWRDVKPADKLEISVGDNIRHKIGVIPPNVVFLPSSYDKIFSTFWKTHDLKGKVFKLTEHGAGVSLYKFCNMGDPARMVSFIKRHKYAKQQVSVDFVKEVIMKQREKHGHSLCDPTQLDRDKQYFTCSYMKGYMYPYAQLVGRGFHQEHLIASTGIKNGYNIIFLDEANLFEATPRRDDKIKSLLTKSSLIIDIGHTNVYAMAE